jgi:hypothetical protein
MRRRRVGPTGMKGMPLGTPTPSPSTAFQSIPPPPPRSHLGCPSSQFDPKAHVHPIGLYKEPCTLLPRAIPETLIHILGDQLKRCPMKGKPLN